VGIYAGIDESGYGPLLGPLVIARSVFRIDSMEAGAPPPCLWSMLPQLLSRRVRAGGGEPGTRIPVNDSKLLYSPARGLRHLERGVLSLLPIAGPLPTRAAELLEYLAVDPESCTTTLPWYGDAPGGTALPVQAAAGELPGLREAFSREAGRVGMRVEELRSSVVFEDRFNQMVGQTRSKARCAWHFVAGHLAAIWERFGEQEPYVVVDRQGGRKGYGPLLAGMFSRTRIEILEETPAISRYRLTGPARRMHLEVRVEAETRHLPVAFASMAAKYLRELLMMRYQDYWRRIAPEIRPTAGYFSDGSRFLQEIEPHLSRLGFPRELLVRCC